MYKCQDCTHSSNQPYNLRRHEKAMHNPSFTEYNSNVNVTALKNKIVQGVNEYQRKLDLGRKI